MSYASGLKVKHPKCPDWGVGQVLAEDEANHVEVVFDQVGLKRLHTGYVQLETVATISKQASQALEKQVNQYVKARKKPSAWKDEDSSGPLSARDFRKAASALNDEAE